eukprot:8753465-Ditylum_brightwellii.AAC.1
MELYDLIDTFQGRPGPPTHLQGKLCIDYAFNTRAVLEWIKECGWLAFFDCISLDHHGIFIDFNKMEVLQGEIHKFSREPKRQLTAEQYKRCTEYRQMTTTRIEDEAILPQLEQLLSKETFTKKDTEMMNTLDSTLAKIMIQTADSLLILPNF